MIMIHINDMPHPYSSLPVLNTESIYMSVCGLDIHLLYL